MPLITREGKGSKLTIQEMDGNLLYLEQLAQQGGGSVVDEIIEIEIPYFFNDSLEGLDLEQPLLRIIEGKFTGFINEFESELIEIEEGFFIKTETKTYKGLFEILLEEDYYSGQATQRDISFIITKLYGSLDGVNTFLTSIFSNFQIIESDNGPRWEKYKLNVNEFGVISSHKFYLYSPFNQFEILEKEVPEQP
jgi:hypothetical protein